MVYRIPALVGVLMILTGCLHIFDINDTLIAIKTGDIATSHAPAVISIWIFAGLGMFLVGVWLLFLSADLKKFRRKAWWQALIIAVSLMGCGIGCWMQYPKSIHLLFFSLMGLILLFPLLFSSGRFWKKQNRQSI